MNLASFLRYGVRRAHMILASAFVSESSVRGCGGADVEARRRRARSIRRCHAFPIRVAGLGDRRASFARPSERSVVDVWASWCGRARRSSHARRIEPPRLQGIQSWHLDRREPGHAELSQICEVSITLANDPKKTSVLQPPKMPSSLSFDPTARYGSQRRVLAERCARSKHPHRPGGPFFGEDQLGLCAAHQQVTAMATANDAMTRLCLRDRRWLQHFCVFGDASRLSLRGWAQGPPRMGNSNQPWPTSLWAIVTAFVGGLLVSLTPCVYR